MPSVALIRRMVLQGIASLVGGAFATDAFAAGTKSCQLTGDDITGPFYPFGAASLGFDLSPRRVLPKVHRPNGEFISDESFHISRAGGDHRCSSALGDCCGGGPHRRGSCREGWGPPGRSGAWYVMAKRISGRQRGNVAKVATPPEAGRRPVCSRVAAGTVSRVVHGVTMPSRRGGPNGRA
jgi:hypothetical protein